MTTAILWAFVALAFATLCIVLIIYVAKTVLPMANALNTLGKLGGYEDEKVYKVIDRIRAIEEKRAAKLPAESTRKGEEEDGATNTMTGIFGRAADSGITLGEQPDMEEGVEILQV